MIRKEKKRLDGGINATKGNQPRLPPKHCVVDGGPEETEVLEETPK